MVVILMLVRRGELIRWIILLAIAGVVIYFDIINDVRITMFIVHALMLVPIYAFIGSMRSVDETPGRASIAFFDDYINIVITSFIDSDTEVTKDIYKFDIDDIVKIEYSADAKCLYIYGAHEFRRIKDKGRSYKEVKSDVKDGDSFAMIETKYAEQDGVDFAGYFIKYCNKTVDRITE